MTLRIGFLASHNGSSMRAIVEAAARGELAVEPALVVSNNADAKALAFARERGLPAVHLSATTEGSAEAADLAIARAMADADVGLIVMSGYMRKVGPATLARFPGRILNIHPALLPRHGGQGMYGRRVHEAVVRDHDAATGATVHVVDGEYDHGPVLRQAEVAVLPGDTAEMVEAKVQALEPGLYIEALRDIIAGGGVPGAS